MSVIAIDEEEKEAGIVLGADPEFVCFNKDGYMVTADNTRFRGADDEIGGDASGRPFEVRPEPSDDPLEVVHNIRTSLLTHTLRNPAFYEYDWKAGSYYESPNIRATPIGGHIHISGQDVIDEIDHLDMYIGALSTLMEQRDPGRLRRRAGYGFASDVREQPYGIEYRTPSSWIVSPQAAAAMLCLMKTVLFEYSTNPDFDFWYSSAAQKAISAVDVRVLRANYQGIWGTVKRMKLYPKYRSYLDFIDFIVSNKLSWTPRRSMKDAWGIPEPGRMRVGSPVVISSIWERFGGKAPPQLAVPVQKVPELANPSQAIRKAAAMQPAIFGYDDEDDSGRIR